MSKKTQGVLVAVIGAAGVITSAWIGTGWGNLKARQSSSLAANVFNSNTHEGISGARIILRTAKEADSEETDSVGSHTFIIEKDVTGTSAKIEISKDGFNSTDLQIILPASGNATSRSFYLVPMELAEKKTVSQTGQASQPTESPRQFVQIVSSGPKASGSGANFSGWYEVCSNPAPSGYHISNVEFSLSGDRTCGAWAECAPSTNTGSQACYRFRMQGHNELAGSGQALSEGILKVTLMSN
ncbi:MAG TPA: hypothetical protein VI685_13975 [Candidatus Angelobacter sp.]